MARVTVENCLTNIQNLFDLTLIAAYRARELSNGSAPLIETKHKTTVTALKEVSLGKIGPEILNKI